MTKAAKFLRLGPGERALILRSLYWMLVYRLGLWVLPFRLTQKWVQANDAPAVAGSGNGPVDPVVRNVARAVRSCSRYVPSATCLTQALTARKLLNRYGRSAALRIGVAKSAAGFEAHAWLEVDGRIVLGKEPLHYRYAVLAGSRSLPV